MKQVFHLILDIIIAVILAIAVLFFIQPTTVKQISMQPTFYENDILLISRQAYRNAEPKRGDVIVFETDLPGDESFLNLYDGELLIKRVIGLPGDTISIIQNELYVNGEKMEESYTKGLSPAVDNPQDGESVTVPDGCYYCMGDNREYSLDSRSSEVGFVKRDRIIGRVFVRLHPNFRRF